MATKKTIKGLTVEIGGDTTKLGKALEGVNKKSQDLSTELGEINKLLKFDPGNTELLAQKQKVLSNAIANTADKLDTLKQAEKQVQQQFARGDVTEEQVRALQREIVETERKMKSYQQAAVETMAQTEKLGDKSKDAAKDIDDLGDSAAEADDILGNFASGGIKGLLGAVTAATAALVACAESSREYRTEMGKLDTAFTTAGFSSEAATETYKELQSVLGETDQAVEAANHLAQLANNEAELAQWTNIATGVYATFGASLPIESLTEAANETAKVGTITGSLADALNWAGVSEDAFQASLDKCNTEQERQALITETLNGLYSTAAEKYRETNAEVIKANEANEALAASTAEVGAAVEPVLNEAKLLGAELLLTLLPAIQWVLDNLPTVGLIIGSITAALVALKVASIASTAAAQGLTAAQAVLNAVMSANPLGLMLTVIAAVIAALALMTAKWGAFGDFFKTLFGAVTGMVTAIGKALTSLIKMALGAGQDLVTGLWKGISDKASWLKNKITGWVGDVTGFLKKLFGINSPSKVTAYMGEMLDEGLAKGIDDNSKAPVEAMGGLSKDLLNEVGQMDGLVLERSISHTYQTGVTTQASSASNLSNKLDQIYQAIRKGQVIMLDGKTLVGSTATRYDNELGQRRVLAERGAI